MMGFACLMHRTPQRSYTPQTLEAWFERLSRAWEHWFTREELRWGRRYYRSAEVRSTELMEDSAIVTFKRGKEALYVIVDWKDGEPQFRQSHPDIGVGRGLAVTGLYELEEFLAEEVPPLPEESEEQGGKDEVAGPSSMGGESAEGNNGQAPTPQEGRRLLVQLQASENGLEMRAGWKGPSGEADWRPFTLKQLSLWEREQLIGYTARAHRCGFRPGDREGHYRLRDVAALGRFFRSGLRGFRESFPVETDASVEAWRKGLQEAQPVIEAEAEGADSRYRFAFETDGGRVPGDVRERLFRHPGHVHFVPGKGIYQVRTEALDGLHEWKSLLPANGEGLLPRYLLFTLGGEPSIEVRLSGELERWREEIRRGAEASRAGELPEFLRPYQREGVRWLETLERGGCHPLLADEMGLGKTLQVLSYLDRRGGLGRERILVVCPASVVPVWEAEVARFYPGTTVRVLSRQDAFATEGPALWLASYSQLRRHKQALGEQEFAWAILDEAQNIKNPDAKVSHACLAIQSRHRLALTGTPMENRLLDVWTLFRFLMPGFLGSRRRFTEAVRTDEDFAQRLRKQLSPFILRRAKREVAEDLPPKVEVALRCPLTPQQRAQYEHFVEGARGEFSGGPANVGNEQRMHLFSLLTRLRQVCCDPSLVQEKEGDWRHSGKLVSLLQHLEEAFASGAKVVVFSQFVQFLRRARRAVRQTFPGVRQVELTGSTLNRERPVRLFRESRGPSVFFISLRAGGTGLNLQTADYVFLLDPWWNPAVEAQAIDRVHRIGQEKRVMVYRFITKGTIEDRIEDLKTRKAALFEDLISDLQAPSAILEQFNELEDLIGLSADGS